MASGFYEDERFNLSVTYAKITFPYIFFISITALLSGVMNSLGSFVAAAAAPILLNLTFILSMFLANYFGLGIGISLAWAVPPVEPVSAIGDDVGSDLDVADEDSALAKLRKYKGSCKIKRKNK